MQVAEAFFFFGGGRWSSTGGLRHPYRMIARTVRLLADGGQYALGTAFVQPRGEIGGRAFLPSTCRFRTMAYARGVMRPRTRVYCVGYLDVPLVSD